MSEQGLTLPLSKVKKIVKLDPEHVSSTEGANFVLGMATELFVMELTHEASLVTKSKRRRKIMYGDFQRAVSANEKYTFMRDIVPKRVPIGDLVQRGQIKLTDESLDQIHRSMAVSGVQDLDEAIGEVPELDRGEDNDVE